MGCLLKFAVCLPHMGVVSFGESLQYSKYVFLSVGMGECKMKELQSHIREFKIEVTGASSGETS